jgi:superfamily II DNA or RNA helicase
VIKILDYIFCQANPQVITDIKPMLVYKGTYRKKSQYGTQIVNYDAHLIDKKGIFLTGLLPKILKRFPNMEIEGTLERLEPTAPAKLPGITPRDDQSKLIQQAVDWQRGILLSPTGSGKTIVAMLLLSRFPKAKVLFLCHSLSIINQTFGEMNKFGFDNLQILGGGKKKFNKNVKITLATIQTFVKLDPNRYIDFFDITIIDEAHHCNSNKNQYSKVMEKNLSPMRIGLTATLPNNPEGKLCLEGYLGPVIGEVTIQEGVKKKILAKPKIKLVPVPFTSSVGDIYKYQDIYRAGIVENRTRNRIILEEANKQIKKGKTALIMVKEIAHGDNLVEMADDLFNMDVVFVQGKTEGENRGLIQRTLDKKIIKCVVCTAVWREGINIKSLDTIILALGGKSAIQTAQALGRGLRIDKGKESVLLIDFLDPYKYLAQHIVARISLYVKNDWM